MAEPREKKTPPPAERYEDIVRELGQVVERLESGGLSLEESIAAFEQGVRLSRAGAARLDEAERRVEQLLEDGRTQPFEPPRTEQAPRRAPARNGRGEGEDVPF